jgi:hypothetical protein
LGLYGPHSNDWFEALATSSIKMLVSSLEAPARLRKATSRRIVRLNREENIVKWVKL